jgi:Rps23 Pro-64 3,4-dihydroxylase Tpa1-like proline 4-hydroxylase
MNDAFFKEIKHFAEPWLHIIIENAFEDSFINSAADSIPGFDDEYWNKGKHFVNEYTNKKEINDADNFPPHIKNIVQLLTSKSFIKTVEEITGIDNLIIDKKIYGGGLAISSKGNYLEKHIDFNFNNDIKLYRAVNLILYLNKNWDEKNGGCFELYDETLKLQKTIVPNINKIIIFASNNKTIHGFNKLNVESRKSINLWYYTKTPPENVDKSPHKTIWFS